jgi:predicted RNA-binding protein YlqC (UPF0109 family)
MTNPENGSDQEKLNQALEHFLRPVLSHPEALSFNVVQGTHILMVEINVHSDDLAFLNAEDNNVFQSLQHILSVTRFERKVTLELLDGSES